ncbi:DUF4169 family protein [Sulfitobacter sp. S190]|uniref:DUF4169 family protein n=1 Tax=Sulfitobacter sp. S190 TaxID=2867022 RepID=UPI0021A4DC5B|nr:DUF4169 family protein [Sulfitobacter sp. S190]UWR23883.1 DUF4169 family protein [Sulfitobacter sp. S190]
MSKPINLSRVRKDKARLEKRAAGDVNAVKFGRTKAEKNAQETSSAKAARDLDAHKREP